MAENSQQDEIESWSRIASKRSLGTLSLEEFLLCIVSPLFELKIILELFTPTSLPQKRNEQKMSGQKLKKNQSFSKLPATQDN